MNQVICVGGERGSCREGVVHGRFDGYASCASTHLQASSDTSVPSSATVMRSNIGACGGSTQGRQQLRHNVCSWCYEACEHHTPWLELRGMSAHHQHVHPCTLPSLSTPCDDAQWPLSPADVNTMLVCVSYCTRCHHHTPTHIHTHTSCSAFARASL